MGVHDTKITDFKNVLSAFFVKVKEIIPTKTSQLTNDSNFLTGETDPTVPDWAKQPTKPTYTKSEVGLGNVPNVTTNDQTPTFTQASSRANIASGEKLSVIFGKTMKFFADLKAVAFSGSYADLSNKPSNATTSADGFMSSTDKSKLDGIASGANAYTHPSYTARTGVPTSNQTPAFGGSFTVTQPVSDATGHITAMNSRTVTIPNAVATQSSAGLESSDDKKKLDGIETGAQVNSITGVKGNAESSYRSGNVNITPSNIGLGNVNNTADADKTVKSSGTCTGNSATATKLATARTIDGVNFDGSAAISHYGTCSTAAATAAKVVALTGFKLVTGAHIKVKFTVTNTASNPTLNVNSTGAKAIYYRGSAISAGYLAANRTYEFVYNGTQWELVGDINTNTTYSTMTGATASAAGKSGLVPAPAAGENEKYLRGDGTYGTPTAEVDTLTTLEQATASTDVAKPVGAGVVQELNNSLTELLKTVEYSIDNVSVASNGIYEYRPDVTLEGYTPIGMVAYSIENATSSGARSSFCNVFCCDLRGLLFRNTVNSAAKVKITVSVLYMKN